MNKLLSFLFDFGKKYRKREEKYYDDSKRLGNSGAMVSIVFYTAVPLLSLWGIFKLPMEDGLGA